MEQVARPWLSLTVATLLLAAYAIVAVASGLDRAGSSSKFPLTFDALQGAALKAETAQAIEVSDWELAERAASQAFVANPSDTEALGLLGSAKLAQGQREDATSTFGIAGRLGWRDLPTQLFWFDNALRAKDWPVAAQRLDAILRVRPTLPEMEALLAAIELQGPEAQEALAERVALTSAWQRRYFDGLTSLPAAQLQSRGQVLASPKLGQAGLKCAQVAPVAGALLSDGSWPLASKIWMQHCDEAGLVLPIIDPDFRLLAREGDLPGLGWTIEPSGDLNVDVSGSGESANVSVENVGVNFALVMSQRSFLAAGQFRITARDNDGSELPAIRAALSCSGKRDLPQSAFVDRGRASISVPADCPDQRLSLWAAPDAGLQRIVRIRAERTQ